MVVIIINFTLNYRNNIAVTNNHYSFITYFIQHYNRDI